MPYSMYPHHSTFNSVSYYDQTFNTVNPVLGVMERFKKTIATLEHQAKLERHQLHSEHHQCVQIDLNDKKNKHLKAFLKALKKTPSDENGVLTAVRKFMKVCTEDRIHK